MHLLISSGAATDNPVALLPGRTRLVTVPLVTGSPTLEGGEFWTERKRLVELAVKSRLPAVYARPLGGRLPSTQCPPKRGAE